MCSTRIYRTARALAIQIVIASTLTWGVTCRVQAEPPQESTLAASDETTTARARRAVMRGETLFEAQNYEAALAEFATAYTLLEGDPRQYLVLHNMAVCHERLFRYDLALQLYARYLAEGGPDARDRREVERVRESLSVLLGRLHVDVNVAADVWIDTRRVGRAPATFLLPAGNHTLELRAPLHESIRRQLQLTSGGHVSLKLTLLKLSRFEGIAPGYFWTSVAVTAVAVGVTAGFGLDALISRSAAENRARTNPFLNTVDDQKRIARSALIADVGLGAAAVFGAISVVLYSLTNWSNESNESHARAARFSILPSISPTAWQAGLRPDY